MSWRPRKSRKPSVQSWGAGGAAHSRDNDREEGDDRFKPTHGPDNRGRGSGDGSRTAGVCSCAPQGAPAGTKTYYYDKGNVRIHYTDIGTGFPLLATPGGGLNSRIAVWANAVINIPEEDPFAVCQTFAERPAQSEPHRLALIPPVGE
jgi:hypothetical protein